MLDVHPPHHAANSWRDFFIHIATIVVGLLIAVGLEQTIEYFHHHQAAREGRAQLFEELHGNEAFAKQYAQLLDSQQLRIREGLDAVARAKVQAPRPEDHIVTMQGFAALSDSAWTTVHGSNATEYMDQRELSEWAYLYRLQAELNQTNREAVAGEESFAALIAKNPENVLTTRQTGEIEAGPLDVEDVIGALSSQRHLAALTPAELDTVQKALEHSIMVNQRLQRNLGWLLMNYKHFEQEHPAH